MPREVHGFAASLLVLTCAAASRADVDARRPERGPVYDLSVGVDVPALLLPAAVSASWFLAFELAPPYCAPRCDPDTVNFIDRPAAGLYSTAWGNLGDIATVGVLATMPLMLVLGEGPANGINDLVVVGEATLLASATQVLVSFATARPRPWLYGDEAPASKHADGHAARSFFSGHTATCVAATLTTFTTLRRVRRPELAWTSLGLGLAGSTFMGVARVGAGSHWPTDVAAGAAVGVGFGLLLPAVHARSSSPDMDAAPRVHFAPVAGPGFAGGTFAGAF
jgi:membrane-associated phospholipid phosphatase